MAEKAIRATQRHVAVQTMLVSGRSPIASMAAGFRVLVAANA